MTLLNLINFLREEYFIMTGKLPKTIWLTNDILKEVDKTDNICVNVNIQLGQENWRLEDVYHKPRETLEEA